MKSAPLLVAAVAVALSTRTAAAQDAGASATGISRAFNPAISANGLLIGAFTTDDADHHHEGDVTDEHAHAHGAGTESGLRVQEVELQLSSFVDPYLKADLILAVPGGEGLELEEGHVTTQGLPGGLTLKAGRFYADLGRHNLLHSHQYPFLDAPLVNERLLGGEGLREDGIGLSWLLPVSWYAELSAQVLDGDNELFASPEGEDLLYLGHLKSFWDLGESTTLELGASAATGINQLEEQTTLAAADLTLKWRPPRRALYRGLIWQSEYLYTREEHPLETRERGGFYSLIQYQFARRWWAQGRYDLYGVPKDEDRDWRASALVSFVPSEFSALRLQYNRLDSEGEQVNQVYVQLNFTIGSHPAHRY